LGIPLRGNTAKLKDRINKEEGKMFWFLDLEFDTPLRYTDCDVDLWGVANFIRRLTEDGDFRVTESGDVRILEQGYESNKYETMPFSPSSHPLQFKPPYPIVTLP
jgi:hypothetical protein